MDALLTVRGERLRLLPERAVLLESTRTLLATDLHLGKDASLRALGLPAPTGSLDEDLDRLSRAVVRSRAERLIILGDLFHCAAGPAGKNLGLLERWRQCHASLDCLLVRGNHDHRAGDPPACLSMTCADPGLALGPFILAHEPGPSPDGYALAGHLHPGVRLAGPARERILLPCFLFTETHAVLPAFGSLTGLLPIRPGRHDKVFVIADDEVVEAG